MESELSEYSRFYVNMSSDNYPGDDCHDFSPSIISAIVWPIFNSNLKNRGLDIDSYLRDSGTENYPRDDCRDDSHSTIRSIVLPLLRRVCDIQLLRQGPSMKYPNDQGTVKKVDSAKISAFGEYNSGLRIWIVTTEKYIKIVYNMTIFNFQTRKKA